MSYKVWKKITSFNRFIVNYNKKHPYRDAVPTDYKVAMVLLPCIFLGISIGVMFHSMVPNVIQEVFLVAVLIFWLREAITKGIKFWKQETLEKQRAKLSKIIFVNCIF